jgi:hypothetical protein
MEQGQPAMNREAGKSVGVPPEEAVRPDTLFYEYSRAAFEEQACGGAFRPGLFFRADWSGGERRHGWKSAAKSWFGVEVRDNPFS